MDLATLKRRILTSLEEAARQGDMPRIGELFKNLEDLERDERVLVDLEERSRRYASLLDGDRATEPVVREPVKIYTDVPRPTETATLWKKAQLDSGETPKERGRRIREDFASRRELVHERGSTYRTSSGLRVGIATASEGQRSNCFLGLPDTQPDCVALLCQMSAGNFEIVLPSSVVSQIWSKLSRSGNQVKFNVFRRNGHLILQIPGASPLSLDSYLDCPFV